jgi:hypothetical protein
VTRGRRLRKWRFDPTAGTLTIKTGKIVSGAFRQLARRYGPGGRFGGAGRKTAAGNRSPACLLIRPPPRRTVSTSPNLMERGNSSTRTLSREQPGSLTPDSLDALIRSHRSRVERTLRPLIRRYYPGLFFLTISAVHGGVRLVRTAVEGAVWGPSCCEVDCCSTRCRPARDCYCVECLPPVYRSCCHPCGE